MTDDDDATDLVGDREPATAIETKDDERSAPEAQGVRFTAPEHTSGITFSTGRVANVEDGILTAPDDLTASEREALALYGFTPA